jgi:hypothetical protein
MRSSLTISDIFLIIAALEVLALFIIIVRESDLGALELVYEKTAEVRKVRLFRDIARRARF